jgi:hypothetical protein
LENDDPAEPDDPNSFSPNPNKEKKLEMGKGTFPLIFYAFIFMMKTRTGRSAAW